MVVVAGVTIHLVFPSLTEVFASLPKLTSLAPVWFAFAVILQAAHFACTIAPQRIAVAEPRPGSPWRRSSERSPPPALSSGRLAFDFGVVLATIRSTGAKPNSSLVLLAYAVAGLLELIPITPGGLGIVEAGLRALLILAGVPGGDAVVATLGYRIISYWLPMAVGPFEYVAFRLRYGPP